MNSINHTIPREQEALARAIDAFASAKVEQALQEFGKERQALLEEIQKLRLDKKVLQDQIASGNPQFKLPFVVKVETEMGIPVLAGRLRAMDSHRSVERIQCELKQLRETFDFEPTDEEQRLVIGEREIWIPKGIGLRPIGVKPATTENGVARNFVLIWEAYRGSGQWYEHSDPQRAVNELYSHYPT